ncbi:MAG: hypothetical protein RQ745_05530 [Longimicrobiales bacterium]|nr:hypothetical protein [Longimicrobiales bacterium]
MLHDARHERGDCISVEIVRRAACVDDVRAEVLARVRAEVEGSRAQTDEARARIEAARAEIEGARTEIEGARTEIERAREEVDEVRVRVRRIQKGAPGN